MTPLIPLAMNRNLPAPVLFPLAPALRSGRIPALVASTLVMLFASVPTLADQPNQGASLVSESTSTDTTEGNQQQQTATLAGGCFWCTEAVFERMEGVTDVVSGYTGGHLENPTYHDVLRKTTGHAEAVEITYDPAKTSYAELLEVFFKTHDPTSLNRQGADIGPQYRSSIFYHDAEQRKIAEETINKLNASGEFDRPIVTKVEEAGEFYPAEEYHQDFYRKNPNHGYCQAVVRNKVRKFNRSFGDKIKKD